MPRNARVTYPGGFYHIYNRGINKETIFRDDADYKRMISIVSRLLLEEDWIIYAYCLMPNHYHFLVEEKHIPIAKLMSRLCTSYCMYFNRKYHRMGPVFQDRFKSKLVQKDAYFLELSRYIHCNPVKAGLVQNVEDYSFSSMGEYVGKSANKIIHREKVLRLIANNKKSLEGYRKFVKAGLKMDLEEMDPFKSKEDVLGRAIFATNRKR